MDTASNGILLVGMLFVIFIIIIINMVWMGIDINKQIRCDELCLENKAYLKEAMRDYCLCINNKRGEFVVGGDG